MIQYTQNAETMQLLVAFIAFALHRALCTGMVCTSSYSMMRNDLIFGRASWTRVKQEHL